MTPTQAHQSAMTAAINAGKASMKAGGRKRFNQQDWTACFEHFKASQEQAKATQEVSR